MLYGELRSRGLSRSPYGGARTCYVVLRFRLFLEEVPVPYSTELHYH